MLLKAEAKINKRRSLFFMNSEGLFSGNFVPVDDKLVIEILLKAKLINFGRPKSVPYDHNWWRILEEEGWSNFFN